MTRRSGLSLTEVLVALFLMAIGVIGVLTMFPVGAVQMVSALKDQRCAEAATQADAYIRWYWRHNIVEKQGGGEPVWTALNGGSTTVPTDDKPSPPVFVDPMGIVAGRGTTVTGTAIPRVDLAQINGNASQALRTCTLLDGLTYDPSGQPFLDTSTGQMERENRYNWLWVLQRPRNSPGTKYNVNMTILVFDKRAHQFYQPSMETALAGSNFPEGQTGVTLGTAGHGPIQRGQWIMDASATDKGVQLANFYRISSINGASAELNLPVRPALGGGVRNAGNAVYFEGLAEVFERSPLTAADPAAP